MSTSRSSSIDFSRDVWKNPCKRSLVKLAMKGRKVTLEGDRWKVDNASFRYSTRLNCIKCLFLAAAHHLKMLSQSYKRKYNAVIEHLNKVQIQRTPRDIAIQDANQQNNFLEEARTKKENASALVTKLEEELSKIEQEYREKKLEEDNVLANLIEQQAALHGYIEVRGKAAEITNATALDNFISFFSSKEGKASSQEINHQLEIAKNRLLAYSNFKDINWEGRKLEELSQMMAAKDKDVEEYALQIKEKTTKPFSGKQKRAQDAINSAKEELERLTKEYEQQLNKMDQSPKRASRPSTSGSYPTSASRPKSSSFFYATTDLRTPSTSDFNAMPNSNLLFTSSSYTTSISRPTPTSVSRASSTSDSDPMPGSRSPSTSGFDAMSNAKVEIPATPAVEAIEQPSINEAIEDVSSSGETAIAAKKEFLATVAKCNQNFAKLWETLLDRFEPDVIESFTSNKDGTYEITLNKALRLWISSLDEKEIEKPKGGVIFLVGSDVIKKKVKKGKKKVEIEEEIQTKKMSFSLQESTMEFHSGFNMYCLTAWWMRLLTVGQLGSTVFAKTRSFVNKGKEVYITAEAHGASNTRKKNMDQLLTNWGERSLIVDTSRTEDWVSTLKLSNTEKERRIAKANELKAVEQKDSPVQDN